jgi:hypothetical protein
MIMKIYFFSLMENTAKKQLVCSKLILLKISWVIILCIE